MSPPLLPVMSARACNWLACPRLPEMWQFAGLYDAVHPLLCLNVKGWQPKPLSSHTSPAFKSTCESLKVRAT